MNYGPPTIDKTRYYMTAFIATLRDTGHSAENVRAVLREFADMVIAQPSKPSAQQQPAVYRPSSAMLAACGCSSSDIDGVHSEYKCPAHRAASTQAPADQGAPHG